MRTSKVILSVLAVGYIVVGFVLAHVALITEGTSCVANGGGPDDASLTCEPVTYGERNAGLIWIGSATLLGTGAGLFVGIHFEWTRFKLRLARLVNPCECFDCRHSRYYGSPNVRCPNKEE